MRSLLMVILVALAGSSCSFTPSNGEEYDASAKQAGNSDNGECKTVVIE